MAKSKRSKSQHMLAVFAVAVVLGIGIMCKYMPNTTGAVVDSSLDFCKEVKGEIEDSVESYDEACARICREKMEKL